MKKFNLNKEIENIFIYEDYLNEVFPKGDERRGEVMTLLGIIYTKVNKTNKKFIKLLKEKVLVNWKGQNEFVDYIDKCIKNE